MKKALLCGISLLAGLCMMEPELAQADGFEKPRRAAPARAAQPARQPAQQSANWSGSQAGGSNGSSSVNNNFVEPGAYNFIGCGGPCYETPFEFSSNKATYIIGGFLGYVLFGKDLDEGALQASGIIGSIIGAVIALLVYRAITRRSRRGRFGRHGAGAVRRWR